MAPRFEAREYRASIEVPSSWADEVALWCRLPLGTTDARTWAMLLVPERVDPAVRFPDSSIHVYQALRWSGPVPPGTIDASVAPRWVRRLGDEVEVAVETTATASGRALASSTTVARVAAADAEDLEELGDGRVPDVPPVPPATTRGKQLVIGERELADFARLMGDDHPLHADHGFARRHGYRNLLVQGHVQLLTVMSFAGIAPRGVVEAWFRHPVTAGSALLAAAATVDGGEVWTLRSPVDHAPATVVRVAG